MHMCSYNSTFYAGMEKDNVLFIHVDDMYKRSNTKERWAITNLTLQMQVNINIKPTWCSLLIYTIIIWKNTNSTFHPYRCIFCVLGVNVYSLKYYLHIWMGVSSGCCSSNNGYYCTSCTYQNWNPTAYTWQ